MGCGFVAVCCAFCFVVLVLMLYWRCRCVMLYCIVWFMFFSAERVGFVVVCLGCCCCLVCAIVVVRRSVFVFVVVMFGLLHLPVVVCCVWCVA